MLGESTRSAHVLFACVGRGPWRVCVMLMVMIIRPFRRFTDQSVEHAFLILLPLNSTVVIPIILGMPAVYVTLNPDFKKKNMFSMAY